MGVTLPVGDNASNGGSASSSAASAPAASPAGYSGGGSGGDGGSVSAAPQVEASSSSAAAAAAGPTSASGVGEASSVDDGTDGYQGANDIASSATNAGATASGTATGTVRPILPLSLPSSSFLSLHFLLTMLLLPLVPLINLFILLRKHHKLHRRLIPCPVHRWCHGETAHPRWWEGFEWDVEMDWSGAVGGCVGDGMGALRGGESVGAGEGNG